MNNSQEFLFYQSEMKDLPFPGLLIHGSLNIVEAFIELIFLKEILYIDKHFIEVSYW